MAFFYIAILVCSAAATYGLIALAQPLLKRFALAHPNGRSSHKIPTPQGAGIFVVLTTVVIGGLAAFVQPSLELKTIDLTWTLASVLLLTVVGAVDDFRPLRAASRLMIQAIAVAIMLGSLPDSLRIVPILPWPIERGLLFIGSLWFVNLVNFMDGIDWMTVSEVAPVTAGLIFFGVMGAMPGGAPVFVAFALSGAIMGFAPFNRPVARLFLGDAGSLPIGLMLAWLLILLAGAGHVYAALLLPLYYFADATITLLRRLTKGEPLMLAHRDHFYQRAVDNGFSVAAIVKHVFLLNLLLVALASVTVRTSSAAVGIATLTAGCALVGWLLFRFARGKA